MKKLILILAVMLGSVWLMPNLAEARPNKGYHYSQKKKVKKHNVKKTKVVRQQRQQRQQRQRVVTIQQPQVNYVRTEDESAASFFARERQRVAEQTQQGVRRAFTYTERTIQYGGDLVGKASRYVGANASQLGLPSRLWCADFMNMITGAGTDRRAISYVNRGRPAYHGCVNCVAVTHRKGGHHVGVVKGYDSHGNPIIISGNYKRRVGVGVYARNRVIAYRYV
jgi:uncharacterized protein (TIGR02594 family)